MKYVVKFLGRALLVALGTQIAFASNRAENTIILDEVAVRNLNIESEEVDERTFETTLFAIGRIEEIPSSRSVLSSRIAGRVIELMAYEGDEVKKDDVLMIVESRQLGDPPPTIKLKAPQDGVVVSTHVRVGQPVSPDAELMDIADQSVVWAVAKIPEQEASTLMPGIKARIHIPALGEVPLEAELTRFGVNANRQAGTIDGIFRIENPDGKLKPGMRVEFSVILKTRPYVLAAPREAIHGDPASRVLFVRDFELPNAFVKSPVVLGEQNDRYVEVKSGLFPGDEVVTTGSYALSFSSGGSGMSLKEALDMAHGHEHNEDGSEITPESRAAKKAAEALERGEVIEQGGKVPGGKWLLYYSIAITLGFVVVLQLLLKRRNA